MLRSQFVQKIIWAATRQNQQNEMCAQQRLRWAWVSTQSDQSLHCALNRQLRAQCFFMRTAKTLIRLGGCPGWSESSQGTQVLVLSCGSSFFTSCLFYSNWVVVLNEQWHEKICLTKAVTSLDSYQPAPPQKLLRGSGFMYVIILSRQCTDAQADWCLGW